MDLEKQDVILIIGAGDFPIYEEALQGAFIQLGYHNTYLETWKAYYNNDSVLGRLIRKVEIKAAFGRVANKFNRDLLKKCRELRPRLIFLYSCRMVYTATVKRLKKMGAIIASYCNDNPFSDYYPWYFWRHYLRALPYCHLNYAYRKENLIDIKRACGREAKLLRSYYIESMNYPCNKSEILADTPDVIFLGHYEDDERMKYIESLCNSGISVGLSKSVFEIRVSGKKNIVLLDNERTLYNRYLCSCKIPITFLSTLNHDTYTRRCFEIPAAGALLFCPYTEDLASMFQEDQEIVFYRNIEDFKEKVKYYLQNEAERRSIAIAGRNRLLKDGHEIKDRAAQIVKDVNLLVREMGAQ